MNNGSDLDSRMKAAERLINALFESHEKTQSELRTLTTSQVLMTEQITKVGKTFDQFVADTNLKFSETTDKLNALIDLVDRHLREHREGTL